jgi:translation elongation factor EF-Tu-like GTPase
VAEFRVTDLFHIPDRGTVLAGTVVFGQLFVGDRMQLRSPHASADITIIGLERDRELLTSASAGDSVAVLVAGFGPELVPDGIERLAEGGYAVRSLTLIASPRKWWQILR